MANVQINSGTGPFVATNAVTRDAQTEEMEIVNVGDPTTGACATVDANGVHVTVNGALPAGTNNIGSVNVAGTVPVSEDGCSYLNINDAIAHTVTASLLVGFTELSGTSQLVSITAYDGTTTAGTKMTAPLTLGAGQIITFPRGGIKATSGSITVQCSSAPGAPGVQLLYHA